MVCVHSAWPFYLRVPCRQAHFSWILAHIKKELRKLGQLNQYWSVSFDPVLHENYSECQSPTAGPTLEAQRFPLSRSWPWGPCPGLPSSGPGSICVSLWFPLSTARWYLPDDMSVRVEPRVAFVLRSNFSRVIFVEGLHGLEKTEMNRLDCNRFFQ